MLLQAVFAAVQDLLDLYVADPCRWYLAIWEGDRCTTRGHFSNI